MKWLLIVWLYSPGIPHPQNDGMQVGAYSTFDECAAMVADTAEQYADQQKAVYCWPERKNK